MNRLVFFMCVVFTSCSATKQLEKAEQRVLANRESVDRVGREWLKLHPCVKESEVKYLPGVPVYKTDTIVYTDVKLEMDTVYKTVTKEVIRTKVVVDTFKITEKDLQVENLLREDLDKANAENKVLQIKLAEEKALTAEQSAKKQKFLWLFIITNLCWAVFVFRKPIIRLVTKIPV